MTSAAEPAASARGSTAWIRLLLPGATMVGLLTLALLPLLTPVWTHAAIDLSGGSVVGGDAFVAHAVSDQTVSDLLLGGAFVVSTPSGAPMYTAAEAGHLADVRVVLYAFLAAGVGSLAFLVLALRRAANAAQRWRSVGNGGAALLALIALLALVGALAFGVAFEVFHRILFPGGNFSFGPDSNLIRLYPFAFWQLSAAAYGLLAAAGAALVWLVGRRRARRLEAR